jgi:hypothetical protein
MAGCVRRRSGRGRGQSKVDSESASFLTKKGQLSSLCGWVSVIYTVATVDVKTMWFHDTASKANSVQLSLMKGFNTST